MDTGGSRRNGRKASCEPCRIAKCRCDHRLPCGRCQRKGMHTTCFYHPAPMTKTTLPRDRSPARTGDKPIVPRCSQDVVFQGDDRRFAGSLELRNSATLVLASRDNGRLQIVVAAVSQLHANYTLLERAIREVHLFISPLVPGNLMEPFVTSLRDLFSSHSVDGTPKSPDLTKLSKAILKRTTLGFVPTADLTVPEFISESCGRNMNVQCLGLICTYATRSVASGVVGEDQEHTEFVGAMAESSSDCLLLARDIVPRRDDMLVWLGFINLMLVRSVKSDSDPIVSRRLGDHINDLYALGLHRENTLQADVPFFLAELRRKTFVMSAFIDKVVATFADIPPRMMERYADTRMPLDLSDTQVLSAGADLQRVRSNLTADGWSTIPNFQSAAWARTRYMLCGWREKVLECSYYPRPMSEQHKHELRCLAVRAREIWDSIPSHLRYTSDCWINMSTRVCTMLTLVYLTWLYCNFQIQRLLEDVDETATIAAEILTTVLQLGVARVRSAFLRHDYEFVALWYGIPSAATLAGLLADSMHGAHGSSKSLPAGMNRAELIRNLSVFVSHLDIVFLPDNLNRTVAMQVSASITRTLDDVLNTPSTVNTDMQDNSEYVIPRVTNGLEQSSRPSPEDQVFSFLDDQGFQDWIGSIDWTAAGSGWGTF